MDVGVADVGQLDAGKPDAGQIRCMTPDCNLCSDLYPNAEICENFDDAVTGPWMSSVGAGGTLGLSDTEFLAGGGALRTTAPAGPGGRYNPDTR